MRAFLDANVLITGAFEPRGFAAMLSVARHECAFVTSEYVLTECERNLRAKAPRPDHGAAAVALLRQFVSRLGVVIVPTGPMLEHGGIEDPADLPVYSGAVNASCDAICTYNLKDFDLPSLRAIPPLAVIESLEDRKGVLVAVQNPQLHAAGTLLIICQLHHPSSLGRICRTQNHVRVFADARGYIRVEGTDVERVRVVEPLQADRFVSFVFRYRASGEFDAVMWLQSRPPGSFVSRDDLERVVLTEGKAKFEPPVTPQLIFEPDHQFAAAVRNISGVPSFLRDSRIPLVLRSGSLEAIAGSASIPEIFNRLHVVQLATGELYTGLHA